MDCDQLEELIGLLTGWDRDTLVDQFLAYRSTFPVDLPRDFLHALSADKLRHLFFALCVQNRRLPDVSCPIAA